MTVEELTDEISAIEAIYPESVTNLGPQLYTFKIPNHESVSIQLNFPLTYPEEIPQLLQIIVEKTTQSSSFTDIAYLENTLMKYCKSVLCRNKLYCLNY